MDGQADVESQQSDMLQALRSAALPDDFWMYSYKILPCPHGYRHSWTHCPFSHAGETARRRCPRTHHYLPDPCVNARAKRQCPNGDACPYAHNTFEQWLHPARYRTRLCYLGANCRRPTCFFAHSVEELRSVDENDSGSNAFQHPVGPTTLTALPIPPPLPSSGLDYSAAMQPSAATTAGSTGNPTAGPAPPSAASAGATGVPMGLYQPIALVCMPGQAQMGSQTHTVIRPDMMAPPAPATYMTYDARQGLPRPPMPPPMPSQGTSGDPSGQSLHGMPMQTQNMVPVALRPQARQHAVGPTVALATMQGGQVHITPAGPVYMGHMAAAAPPQQHMAYVGGPYGVVPAVGGGYFGSNGHVGGEGVPPSVQQGRVRSWSNPGESFNLSAGGQARTNGQQQQMYGNSDKTHAVLWAADANRRIMSGATGLPPGMSSVPASALSPIPSPPQTTRGGTSAPRHMPAPTNRGNAVRRTFTPTSLSAHAVNAAAVAAMRYPSADGSVAIGALPRAAETAQSSAENQVEAALQSMTLTKSMAAPPPTPAASHAGGSPYNRSLSTSPLAAVPLAAMNSSDTAGLNGIGNAAAEFTFQHARASLDGGAAAVSAGTYSRPSSAGSVSSSGQIAVFDASAAAAAALAAVAAISVDPAATAQPPHPDAVAAVSVPYRALLQHVLRSASASAAEPPSSGLLPAILCRSTDADLDALYDDIDGPERASDPGPNGSLRAAIRRISTELGTAVVNRNSDPGQAVPAAGMEQLLLPLLQSVLTEGLATGQFELVNGQLQVKSSSPLGSSGPSGTSFGASVPSAGSGAVEGSVGVVGSPGAVRS